MRSVTPRVRARGLDRVLRPVHYWIWGDAKRRAYKLLRFAEVEADGGRDILRAAEVTSDPLLRRLYLTHARDELRHAVLFRQRGGMLVRALATESSANSKAAWLGPGDHGLDDLRVEDEPDASLLAFLHLSEKAAAGRFTIYRDVVRDDPPTRAIFEEILRDEVFHMTYTYKQLVRISPRHHGRQLWWARATRLWKSYLRIAVAVAGVLGTLLLTIQYFVLLPPFAWFAKRAARAETPGWKAIPQEQSNSLQSQY